MTEAHPAILDRDSSVAVVKETTDRLCATLREIVNYGTQAHVRCRETFPVRDEHLGVLFSHYQVIEMLDAAEVLLSQAVCTPATLQLRACFENILYMTYISIVDSERRGLCYIFCDVQERINFLDQVGPGKNMDDASIREGFGAFQIANAEIQQEMEPYNRFICSDKYKMIREEYLSLKKKVKFLKWYSLFGGPKRISELAKHCGLESGYIALYSTWSCTMHGRDMRRLLVLDDTGRPATTRLRDCRKIEIIGALAIWLGTEANLKLLQFFRPAEEINHRRWYRDNIRDTYNWLKVR